MTNNYNYNFDLEGHYVPESVRRFIEGFIQQFIADKQKSEASKRFDDHLAKKLALEDFLFLMRDRYGCYVTINWLFDIADFKVTITLRKDIEQ